MSEPRPAHDVAAEITGCYPTAVSTTTNQGRRTLTKQCSRHFMATYGDPQPETWPCPVLLRATAIIEADREATRDAAWAQGYDRGYPDGYSDHSLGAAPRKGASGESQDGKVCKIVGPYLPNGETDWWCETHGTVAVPKQPIPEGHKWKRSDFTCPTSVVPSTTEGLLDPDEIRARADSLTIQNDDTLSDGSVKVMKLSELLRDIAYDYANRISSTNPAKNSRRSAP